MNKQIQIINYEPENSIILRPKQNTSTFIVIIISQANECEVQSGSCVNLAEYP